MSRDEIINSHTTCMSKILLNAEEDAVITIWDANYFYIEKSSSYDFQRRTYSGHKFRCLVKFMICCSTDGFLMDVQQLYRYIYRYVKFNY